MSDVEFTSESLRSIRFAQQRRGYATTEVESFVAHVAEALARLETNLHNAQEEIASLRAERDAAEATDASLRRTLVLAQRTAEMAIAEANEEAQRVRTAAADEASHLQNEATQLRADAEAEAERLRNRADAEIWADREAAKAEASELVETAHREADRCRHEAEELLADAEQRAATAVQQAEDEARRAAAQEAARVQEELNASIAALTSQRDDLWRQVGELAEYLAAERARVLEFLGPAVERFSATLTPSRAPDVPRPAVPEPETVPTDAETTAEAHEAWAELQAQFNAYEAAMADAWKESAAEPSDGHEPVPEPIADDEAAAVPSEETSSLLVTLGEEVRASVEDDTDEVDESAHDDGASEAPVRPRKGLLARRRS
jgi:DivIVA domain-containing protein